MTFTFSKRSLNSLRGVHPDLVKVAKRAIELTPLDFGIACGVRTLEQQRDMVRRRVSRTMKSKHLPQSDGFGHAIDISVLVNGRYSANFENYRVVSKAFYQAANDLGVGILWGGEWATLRDGPHFQLK